MNFITEREHDSTVIECSPVISIQQESNVLQNGHRFMIEKSSLNVAKNMYGLVDIWTIPNYVHSVTSCKLYVFTSTNLLLRLHIQNGK